MEPARRDDDHNAGRRARELYRYFRPERTLSPTPLPPPSQENSPTVKSVSDSSLPGSSPCSAPQPPSSAPPLARVVPDDALVLGDSNATLTSFAQLAALRLDVERVLISVSDRDSQFILAQSSRSSASKPTYQAPGEIWDGCSRLPNESWQMCRDTVTLKPSFNDPSDSRFLVVDDLRQHDKYNRLPFVEGEPQFRFYAGTPLTTQTNINIGCLFVLDTKPHDGLLDVEKETMRTLSMLIMDYLKVSRQASDGRRATRLSRGLSCFVEGSSSFVETTHPSYAGSFAAAPGTPANSNSNSNQKATHLSVGSLGSFELPSRHSPSSDARSISSFSEGKGDNPMSSNPDTPLPDWLEGSRQKVPHESHDNTWAFRRAANLLRESLELSSDGGVMFVEAGNIPMMDHLETASDCSAGDTTPAPVLAISTNEEPFAPGPRSTGLYPSANLDSGFLHELLRRYSKGKLWSFHRDGLLSSSDDESPNRNRAKTIKAAEASPRKKWKTIENTLLNLYFPNATQVIFVPLWNAANSQWFAGCFCWNTVETQVFNSSVELSSIMGFGSSIMAECSRVESLISDRQKGDFIGSISHELRSPLHGILAAAEFLGGTDLDDFQGSLLETINACGRTLLDTMNQVLDFSKIVSLERSWRQMKKNRTSSEVNSLDRFSAHLDSFVATDLAILAEEVVEGVCLGHSYSQRSNGPAYEVVTPDATVSQSSRSQVDVEVDIAQNDWVYQTQPGALRRIIMNVFGNAMKYTESGRVSLHLAVTEASECRARRLGVEELVTLTVSDTGKGISEEFLRGRLYTPFAQEDTLAVGTGLGLSIVRSLVRSLNGTINITSHPGDGTTVKVSLPLLRSVHEDIIEGGVSPRSPSATEKGDVSESVLLRNGHAGRRAGILGLEPKEAAEHPSWSIIARYLTDWYGLELVSLRSTTPVDVVIATDDTLTNNRCDDLVKTPLIPSMLVICDRSISYNAARTRFSSHARVVNIIRRPCGPHKLARCIRKCLTSDENLAPSTAPTQPILTTTTNTADTLKTNTTEVTTTLAERPRIGRSPISDEVAGLTNDTSSSSRDSSQGSSSEASSGFPDPLPTIASPLSPVRAGTVDPLDEAEQKRPVSQRARVLVVDDNSINLTLMLTFMKKRNLDVLHSAENGKLAVEEVEKMQQGYDLIFMDISMPVMNGFEATRAIRALENERDVYRPAIIIALTGLSSSRDETEALTSGVDLFLTKPVSFKEVSRILQEWEDGKLSARCNE